MGDDRTRKRVRGLLTEIDPNSGQVPLETLVGLADEADRKVTIDRSEEPPLVFVEPTPSAKFDVLSKREREVASWVATGRSNQEIAEALFISVATVKDHVHAILTKTGLRNRAAVIGAWHRGDF